MIEAYLDGVRERLTEHGRFWPVETALLSEPLASVSLAVYLWEESGLTTLVALLRPETEVQSVAVRESLAFLAMGLAKQAGTEVAAVMLLVTGEPLTPERYQQWQQLKLHQGPLRLLPWVADLTRDRLFEHIEPPFGTNPDLALLFSPHPGQAPVRPTPTAEPRFPVTYALIALVVGIWVVMSVQGVLQGRGQMDLMVSWGAAARPGLWYDHEPWRYLTSVFLHFGVVHLGVNSFSLWVVGRAIEFLFGWRRMLYIFLVSGVAGSVGSALLGVPFVVSAGASGAIFGLLGAVVWYRLASPLGDRIAWRPLVLTLVLNLTIGFSLASMIDNWAHLGGLAGGFVAAATAGVPVIPGLAPPRFHLAQPLRIGLISLLLVTAAVLVSGVVEVPGPGRDLARAVTQFEAGEFSAAEPGFERAKRLQPQMPSIRFMLGAAYYNQGKCSAAQGELEWLQSKAPGFSGTQQLSEAMADCPPTLP